ncbi:F-box protein At5g07610-like [Camellia sinensis]|uniref:F-box protein At5g07610-like n=1 Tax=Camellia sinensis TaxID=4442 RepID=UPI001036185F|nr:F-box protein At5g07610-like [Camellia sinensis]
MVVWVIADCSSGSNRFPNIGSLSSLTPTSLTATKSSTGIPSSLFLQLHRSSRLNNPEYEFVSFNDPLTFTPPFRILTFIPDPSGLKILQSCNGLLFCCSSQTHNLKRKYYVYNHTTKQFTTLPTLGFGSPRPVHGVNFAFNPAKSPHYKVMCVQSSDFSSEHYQIKIYSSNTGPWRVSGQPFIAHVNIQFNCGVYWNGAIHWLSIRGDPLCFVVDKKCLQIMSMPPLPSGYDRRWFNYFGESGDHLHLIERYRPPNTQFNIYELERPFRVVCEVSNRPWFSCC